MMHLNARFACPSGDSTFALRKVPQAAGEIRRNAPWKLED